MKQCFSCESQFADYIELCPGCGGGRAFTVAGSRTINSYDEELAAPQDYGHPILNAFMAWQPEPFRWAGIGMAILAAPGAWHFATEEGTGLIFAPMALLFLAALGVIAQVRWLEWPVRVFCLLIAYAVFKVGMLLVQEGGGGAFVWYGLGIISLAGALGIAVKLMAMDRSFEIARVWVTALLICVGFRWGAEAMFWNNVDDLWTEMGDAVYDEMVVDGGQDAIPWLSVEGNAFAIEDRVGLLDFLTKITALGSQPYVLAEPDLGQDEMAPYQLYVRLPDGSQRAAAITLIRAYVMANDGRIESTADWRLDADPEAVADAGNPATAIIAEDQHWIVLDFWSEAFMEAEMEYLGY